MNVLTRGVLATTVAASALFGTAAPASADHSLRDLCAGVVEIDGCWFCAYQQTPVGQAPTNCHWGFSGYTWERCTGWVYTVCVTGSL